MVVEMVAYSLSDIFIDLNNLRARFTINVVFFRFNLFMN
jgi:hypothetical protein